MKRKGFSVRKRTNKKKKHIWKRMHKVQNYHHFVVFRLPDMDISSEESETDEESEEITDAEESSSKDSSSEEVSSTEDESSDSEGTSSEEEFSASE